MVQLLDTGHNRTTDALDARATAIATVPTVPLALMHRR